MPLSRTHETSQRDFEATEKLTYELSMAENENTQLKTNIKNLERVLEIERQERSATEHKTLQVLQDVRVFFYFEKKYCMIFL